MNKNALNVRTAGSVYVISTMTSDVSYCFWEYVNNMPRLRKKVTIRGGAGIPSIKSGFGDVTSDNEGKPMWTAEGIVTPISADAYEELKDHHVFKKHVASGRISISSRDITDNHKAVKKVIEGMEKRDSFAQLTKETYKDKVKVTTSTDIGMSDFPKN